MADKKDDIPNIPDNFDNVVGAIVGGYAGGQKVLDAVYSGQLPIGDIELDCAVLDGGVRVLSERAVHRAFGSKRGGSHWKRMKENAREADRKNPNFDHDSEVFTRSTLYMGVFLVLFGLPFALIGIWSLSSLGDLPQGNVDLFGVIEVFWQPFEYLLFAFVGLGLQYMGLYSCWRYFVQ